MTKASDTSRNVRDAYQAWAEIYDTNENATRDLNAQTLRQVCLPLKGKQVLEIGCGTGLNTEYLAQHAAGVIGVDISENMLTTARKRLKQHNVRFVAEDITQGWPFDEKSFDLVVANLVLEHIEELSHIYNEAWHVLKPGGQFYLAELHPYKQLQNSQAKYISPATGREVRVDAFLHSVSDYITCGKDADFTLQEIAEYQQAEDDVPRLLTLLFAKQNDSR